MTKSFFNENWQELESQIGSKITSYVWGLRYIDDLVLREKGTERLYSLADPNWNVVTICNDSGDIQERYTYDAFGKRNIFDEDFTEKTGTEFDWNRAFTGQILDIETGLMLYRMRYYDTDFGRFINRDPIEYESGDVNIYRYLFNFPLVDQDSFGLQSCFDYWGPIETRRKFIFPNKFEITQGRLHVWMTEEKDDCGNIKCVQTHSAWIKIRQFTLTIKPPIDIHPKPPLPPINQPGKIEGGIILNW